MKKQIFIAIVLLMGFIGCQKDIFAPTPNQTLNEDVLKPHTPTIKIDEVKKWFDEQTKSTSSSASSSADSSLFQTTPRWGLASNQFSQVGSEFVVAPLTLKLRGEALVASNLLVRRLPNGSFTGRYALYFPTAAYRNQVQGHYNPLDFTGSVVYTDLNGHYTHGFKVENGQITGTATALKNDGRGGSTLRLCITTTYCAEVEVVFRGNASATYEDCFDVTVCYGVVSGGTGTNSGWNDGTVNGGISGSSGGSSSGGSWGSNQPPVVLGELTYEARQFLISKGFDTSEQDYLSTFPTLLNQILNYLVAHDTEEGKKLCLLHTKTLMENPEYKSEMQNPQQEIGTNEWLRAICRGLGLSEPNDTELNFGAIFPYQFLTSATNSRIAIVVMRSIYQGNTGNDNDRNIANAFQHCYWNALNTASLNRDQAKLWGDAHENGATDIASQMDYFNNEIGRKIIADNEWNIHHRMRLPDFILSWITQGNLEYVCVRRDSNGQVISQTLNFTNQTCQ